MVPQITNPDVPAFLMCPPLSFDTTVANNQWMADLADDERRPDRSRAFTQWCGLYRFVAAESIVYLLPAPAGCGLQDVVFTANLGAVIDDTMVVSNFVSDARRGEQTLGAGFAETLGYQAAVSPHRFEGEAELKPLSGGVFAGGWGQRTDPAAYDWLEATFGVKVVRLRLTDPYLFHLDCAVFPLTAETTLVCTALFDPADIRALEAHTGIIDVPLDDCYAGICNNARLGNLILNGSHLHELRAGSDEYREEVAKNRRLEDIAADAGMEVAYFNLSEFHKGGGLLSCMVLHLNRVSYNTALL